jgi:hypothetical protein
MGSNRKIKVAIVVSHPIQHFVHLYKALAKNQNIELKVFFASNIGAREYFDKKAQNQMESVDNSFMRQSNPDMPLFAERKSTTTRGRGFGGGEK